MTQPVLGLDKTLPEFKDIRDNLSAIVLAGEHFWLGGDEGTKIDRLTRQADGNFAAHRRFDLANLLDLPAGGSSEIDIEGLDVNEGYLWLIGSHSLKRAKPGKEGTEADKLWRIAQVTADGNRYTLGRVPLDANSEPAAVVDARQAARLEGNASGNPLFEALRADKLIGPFCAIPSKDNGLDIEGLAVRGNRVLAGLRGPVLRGWAVVLDFEVEAGTAARLKLSRAPRKHLLELDGLGVRDLAIHGADLYILAGPTMDLDGPVFVYRWKQALDSTTDSVVTRKNLHAVLAVPFGRGGDHAEGITLLPGLTEPPQAMICYDSPVKAKLDDQGQTRADIFDLANGEIV